VKKAAQQTGPGSLRTSLATQVQLAFEIGIKESLQHRIPAFSISSGLHQAALDQLSIRPIQSIFSDGLGFHPAHETPDALLEGNLW
jgi:hypothetical protein